MILFFLTKDKFDIRLFSNYIYELSQLGWNRKYAIRASIIVYYHLILNLCIGWVHFLFSILIFLISLFQFRWFFEDVVAILAYEHHHDSNHCLVHSWFLKELFIKRYDALVISLMSSTLH